MFSTQPLERNKGPLVHIHTYTRPPVAFRVLFEKSADFITFSLKCSCQSTCTCVCTHVCCVAQVCSRSLFSHYKHLQSIQKLYAQYPLNCRLLPMNAFLLFQSSFTLYLVVEISQNCVKNSCEGNGVVSSTCMNSGITILAATSVCNYATIQMYDTSLMKWWNRTSSTLW